MALKHGMLYRKQNKSNSMAVNHGMLYRNKNNYGIESWSDIEKPEEL